MEENNVQQLTSNLNNQNVTQENNMNLSGAVQANVISSGVVAAPYTPENPENKGIVTNSVVSNTQVNSSAVSAQIINPTPANTTVVPTPGVESANPTPANEAKPEIISRDKFIIKTSVLKNILNNISKVAVDNPRIILSTVVQLTFDSTGFKATACDTAIGNYVIQKDTSVSYTEELNLGVPITLFKDLVGKIDCEEVEIKFDNASRILMVDAKEEGIFKFQEIYDIDSQESIHLELPEIYNNIQTSPIDIVTFKRLLANATISAADPNASQDLAGVLCTGDHIYSTDKYNMSAQECNFEMFKQNPVYLTKVFTDLVTGIGFGDNTEVGFVKDDNGIITHIILKSNNTVVAGPVMPDDLNKNYPIEAIKAIISDNFGQVVSLNKNALIKAIDKIRLFMEKQDKQLIDFTLSPQGMKVTSKAGTGNTIISAKNCTENVPTIQLKPDDFLSALSILVGDEITYKADANIDKYIVITDGSTVYSLAIQYLQ